MQDAEAYKEQRINEANGQVARFEDTYAEYVKYPLITKKRMFYETMEEVLPDLKVIITGGNGTQTLLPLEPFSETASTYAVTIDSIEKLTNMDFFSPLPDEIENEVEANADYYQWPH